MADGPDSEAVCIVHNIPKSFHARDLRNYFSQFLEKGSFICFHYRHRPEVQQVSPAVQQASGTDEVAQGATETQQMSSVRSGGEISTAKKSRRAHAACCATLKLLRRHLAEFISLYDRKHWVVSSGSYLSQRCFISRLRLPSATPPTSDIPGDAEDAACTTEASPAVAGAGAAEGTVGLDSMIEFRPPADMPRGNVGTPTAYFLAEIQKCRLPASLVKRLGLMFPRSARRRQYSSVPLDYGTAPVLEEEDAKDSGEDEEARTGSGAELLDRIPTRLSPAASSVAPASATSAGAAAGTTSADKKQQPSDPPRASDETTAEETDRHEALHNDVTSQGRTKERMYEEEIELVWEKGGPGLVWYTDAAYWDQQRGDFDERTADDWDVDMSGYEPGAGPGDRDARESRNMRHELRLRAGQESDSAFERKRDRRARNRHANDSDDDEETTEVGAFDRHTRGFGRRVMLNLGWSVGRGLGTGAGGIAEPLPNAGQTDRRGLGFMGEQLERRPVQKRRADSAAGTITTAYSDPRESELEQGVDVTLPPTHMKFRRPEK